MGIGADGLRIDLDNIVVLVGPNNSGKSTVLKAFNFVASDETKLGIDYFYKSNPKVLPEIEIWSEVINEDVHVDKKFWVDKTKLVKEKWFWTAPDTDAKRVGYRVDKGRWAIQSDDPRAPFSNDGGATAFRPSPTYISPFEQPTDQVNAIKKIISDEIYEIIKTEKRKEPKYVQLQKDINSLQDEIRSEAKSKEEIMSNSLEDILNRLFSNTKISLNIPQSSPDILASYAASKDIDFKINNLSLENQGSGMQRAILWSVLKMLAGRKKTNKSKSKKVVNEAIDEKTTESLQERTKILLMDEPEICLHPESIRQAKEILYDLASTGEWQVMITTHSPIFIDLSKNNTNIIRVQKDDNEVNFYKTNDSDLSNNEVEELKMLNIFDPYFAEFFFAKNVIVVEGDTEYTAFKKIIDKDKYRDIHIIRARGKYTILPIVKILAKWGKSFSILHDSDKPDNKQSWPANKQILELVNSKVTGEMKIKLLACKTNFELAFFGANNIVEKDKPFNSYMQMENEMIFKKVNSVFEYLCNQKSKLTVADIESVCEYKTINELAEFVK